MQTARPTKDEASLPRRFRTVLFLDVFGDAAYDPTEAEHATVTAGVDGKLDEQKGDVNRREIQQTQAAHSIFAMEAAQSALRCWEAVPQDLLTRMQATQLSSLRQEFSDWRHRYHGCLSKMKSRRGVPYDPIQQDARALRTWEELTALEQQQNEFYSSVIGPLQRRADGSVQYYDLMRNVAVWTLAPGTKVLDMTEVVNRVQNVEHEVTALLKTERGDLDAIGVADEPPQESRPFIFKARKRVGHHRLPWKSVRRMTAVLQVCWTFLAVQSFLSSMGIWSSELNLGRRLASNGLDLIDVPVRWPHNSFFRPSALFCTTGHVHLDSPYVQYQVKINDQLGPAILHASSSPVGTVTLDCDLAGCITAELEEAGKALSLTWTSESQLSQIRLQIRGDQWLKIAGTRLPCSKVQLLLRGETQPEELCFLIAAWDGKHLPLVAFKEGDNITEMKVRAEAPLQKDETVLALHVSQSARLWALHRQSVQAWDLMALQPSGAWKLGFQAFQATSICEENKTLLLGGFLKDEPRLFRTELPGPWSDRGQLA